MIRILTGLVLCTFCLALPAQEAALEAEGPIIAGQAYTWNLSAPSEGGAMSWILLSGLDGPPVALGSGRELWLGVDELLVATANGVLPQLRGPLLADGSRASTLVIPDLPELDGFPLHTAFVSIDPTDPDGVGVVSNTVRRRISSTPAFDFSSVDAALQVFASSPLQPDIAFVLVKDGQIVHQSFHNGFDAASRVPLASATKWASGWAVMRLVEMGLVDLDDPVSLHLPSFTGAKAAITLRQCMSHTSGLPAQSLALINGSLSLEQAVDAIAAGPLLATPGTEFRYGGTSMQVAGRVAEVVTGTSWSAFFAQEVAGPLGMTDFAYDGLGVTDNPRIAGGGACTILDFAQLLMAFLDGGAAAGSPSLSTSAVRTMALDQTAGATIASSPQPGDQRYGIGIWREEVGAFDGARILSSPGALGAYPWVDLERGYGALILIDSGLTLGRQIYTTLRPLIEAQIPSEVVID